MRSFHDILWVLVLKNLAFSSLPLEGAIICEGGSHLGAQHQHGHTGGRFKSALEQDTELTFKLVIEISSQGNEVW